MQIGAKTENRHDFMMKTPLHKLIPIMALPTIISMMISSLYNMADTYFVSQLGTYATGAIGINVTLDHVITMAGMFIAQGVSSYVSRLLGAKNNKKAEQVLATGVLSAFICGTIVLVFGLVFLRPLVRFLGATPALEQYAVDYAVWMLIAAPFMCISFVIDRKSVV